MPKKYKWLVIQGCRRSGTSILTDILNSNEELGITYELNFNKFKIGEEKLAKKYENIFKDKKERISYFGDKMPSYCLYSKRLRKKIKNFKTIHISRNPLNVISSIKRTNQSPWESWNRLLSVKDACALWIYAWNEINKLKNNPDVLHLKYESLVGNPHDELKRIANFLKINNYFDTSIISENRKPVNLNEAELKTVNKYLGDVINNWGKGLKEIERSFPKLKNLSFPRTRIILKSFMWDALDFLKRIKN